MNNQTKFILGVLFATIVLGCCVMSHAGDTYYVDDVNGLDSRNTTEAQSISTPWKTITKGMATFSGGDTLYIRAGTYYEHPTLSSKDGTVGDPTEIGAYNDETVILDGTAAITGWTKCVNEDPNLTIGGVTNPNYDNIYWARFEDDDEDIRSPIDFGLYEDGVRSRAAEDPNQTVGYQQDNALFTPVTSEADGYDDRVIDSDLTQDDDYWSGASGALNTWVRIWMHLTNNTTEESLIDDFGSGILWLDDNVPANISHDAGSNPDAYSIVNHPHILDGSGEYYYREDPADADYIIICYWPKVTANLENSKVRYATGKDGASCIRPTEEDYIYIDGLTVRRYLGSGIYFNTSDDGNNVGSRITNCIVEDVGLDGNYSLGGSRMHNGLVDGCTLTRAGGRGLYISGANDLTVSNNTVTHSKSTSISLAKTLRCIAHHNTVTGDQGNHGNCLSVYDGCRDTLVAHNYFVTSSGVTENNGLNSYFFGNVMRLPGNYAIRLYTSTYHWGPHWFTHNTLVTVDPDDNNLCLGIGKPFSNASGATLTTGTDANDYTDTATENNVWHKITPAGTTIDMYYEFDLYDYEKFDGKEMPTNMDDIPIEIELVGRLHDPDPNDDSITISIYNWDTTSWDTVTTWEGTDGGDIDETRYTTNVDVNSMGTGANFGITRVKFSDASLTAGTILYIDSIQMNYTADSRIQNTITAGVTGVIPPVAKRTYNLHLSTGNAQSGWTLGTGEVDFEAGDYNDVFTNYDSTDGAECDFTLITTSPAKYAGVASPSVPSATFPAYDFSVDLTGRAWANPPSMGAYEFDGGTPTSTGSGVWLIRQHHH